MLHTKLWQKLSRMIRSCRFWCVCTELALVIAFTAVVIYGLRTHSSADGVVIIVTLIGVCLVTATPIVIAVLIGRPPVWSLAPLLVSRRVINYRKRLLERPELNDADFYARFYSPTDIPRDVPIGLRQIAIATIDQLLSRLHPTDLFYAVDDELDLADFVAETNRRFAVTLNIDEFGGGDFTFDCVVRAVHARCSSAPSGNSDRFSALNE